MIQTHLIAGIIFTDGTWYISFLKGEIKHALLAFACCFLLSSAMGQSTNLFDSDDVMELTLRGDLKTVFKDRGDDR